MRKTQKKKATAENPANVTLNGELRPISEWTENQIQEIVDVAVRFTETQDKLIADLEAAIATGDRERVWAAANRLCTRGEGKVQDPLPARKQRKEPPKIVVKAHYPPNCSEAANGWLQALRILMNEDTCNARIPRVKGRPVFLVEATPYQNIDGFDVCRARLIANYGAVQRVVGVLELTREEWREISSHEVAS